MTLKNPLTAMAFTLLAAWTLPSASQVDAAAPIKVEYRNPEKFTDVGSSYGISDKARAAYLEQLSKHLVLRAKHRLPQDQTLTVTITEVDMAGSFEPWRPRLGDVRIVRDVYPPRIDLHFKL